MASSGVVRPKGVTIPRGDARAQSGGRKERGGGGVRKGEGEDVLHARGTATRTREGGAETDDAETRGHWNETILNKYPGEADDKRDEQNQHESAPKPGERVTALMARMNVHEVSGRSSRGVNEGPRSYHGSWATV